jgi:phosphoribulokinase
MNISNKQTSIIISNIPNNAPVISRIGTDDTFVELSFRRLGAMVELVATRVEYDAFNGKYLRDELGREVVEEDSENAAVDLEWAA